MSVADNYLSQAEAETAAKLEALQTHAAKRCKPVRNLRRVLPHVCGVCHFGRYDEGSFVCARIDGPSWDAGDGWEYLHTCDYWTAPKDGEA